MLSPQMEEGIGLLQFFAAATTVRENGYVKLKDFDFFVNLICISIVSKKLVELDNKLAFDLLAESNPKIATEKWALMMLPLFGESKHNQRLAELLSQWAALVVIQSKIQTCEACFDHKGADAIRVALK